MAEDARTKVMNVLLSCVGEELAMRIYVMMVEAGIRFR
jgi:hypothetical protein